MSSKGNKLFIFLGGLLLLFPSIFLLTGCAPLSADDVVNSLMPNLWVFLTHVFACIFLFIIIMWLVWKPTKSSLDKRRAYIENEIREAEKSKKEAFDKLHQAEVLQLEAHTKAKIIINNATDQAYVKKEAIENEGKINAKKIVDDAQEQLVRMEQSLKQNNEKQILDIAFSATEALLQKNFSREDNEKLVHEFIEKLSKKQVGGK